LKEYLTKEKARENREGRIRWGRYREEGRRAQGKEGREEGLLLSFFFFF
jgi:hypothetical protein